MTCLEAWIAEYDRRASHAAADRAAPFSVRRARVAMLERCRDELLNLALAAIA